MEAVHNSLTDTYMGMTESLEEREVYRILTSYRDLITRLENQIKHTK